MNFERLPFLEDSKTLLDIAFRKAREKKEQKTWKGKPIDRAKNKESLKLDIIHGYLFARLTKSIKSYPSLDHLPQFYIKLLQLTLDPRELKSALASLSWAAKRTTFFHRNYVRKIRHATDYNQVKDFQKQFYGRISSVMKQIDPAVEYLNASRRIMKDFPDIKEEYHTVCIYGFPNLGKSTLLNELTGTTAKTASYSFTTKTINVGYLKTGLEEESKKRPKNKDRDKPKKSKDALAEAKIPVVKKLSKIQICDLPGTLARKDKMNNIELHAELVLNELAECAIYIFDPTRYDLIKKQVLLYKKVKKQKPTLLFLSKTDLVNETELEDYKQQLLAQMKQKDISFLSLNELKKELIGLAS